MSLLSLDKEITNEWLKENGWIKTEQLTPSRNPWWTKLFVGRTPNGGTKDLRFAYNDETNEINYMVGFPYPAATAKDTDDVNIFINESLKGEKLWQVY